jgi:Flp pilus assembly protein TadD
MWFAAAMTCPGPRKLLSVVILILLLACCGFSQTANDAVIQIQAELQSHNSTRALELVHAALQKSPGDPRLWTLQGAIYSAQGNKKD